MIVNLPYFREIKEQHAKDILMILLERDESFSVLAHTPAIKFDPELPKNITEQFTDVIIFAIANYTLQSAHISDDNFVFEAGFGEENIGSVVTVPISNIIQITQDEVPLFVNAAATLPKEEKPKNPFAANPRNKKFIKD
ncbi:hypothetical protein C3L23_02620 [Nautilia sp. PV-1]|uniref:hypothetical protein n=1 Tax=Nautilia sp. PV-1 TaxID=2579250 RepID=UPI000FDBFA4C|nr:hypothetical protein [Nautilia sp. PV-1]AZV46203.1 hypothetical protein C3L23_02620 [Nautilia sp. PV-1]